MARLIRYGISVNQSELLTLDELALFLGRGRETIRKDFKRNPAAVPPRIVIPGTRGPRWRMADVQCWLSQHMVSEEAYHD